MKSKTVFLLAAFVLAAAVFAGCAQDSTDTSDDNPQMQKEVAKEAESGKTGSSSTNPSQSKATGATKGTKVALSADPSGALKYNTDKLNANAGALTVAFTNESAVPHDVAISNSSGKKLGVSDEITKSNTSLKIKDIAPGSYTFFCTVPGHEQAGMKGTLTVK